jgi:hypothetical protein
MSPWDVNQRAGMKVITFSEVSCLFCLDLARIAITQTWHVLQCSMAGPSRQVATIDGMDLPWSGVIHPCKRL